MGYKTIGQLNLRLKAKDILENYLVPVSTGTNTGNINFSELVKYFYQKYDIGDLVKRDEVYMKDELYTRDEIDKQHTLIDESLNNIIEDLDNFEKYTNEELNLKADKSNTYTRDEINQTTLIQQDEIDKNKYAIQLKADKDSVYNKDETYSQVEIDEKLETVPNIEDVYNTVEVDNLLNLKADKKDTYTKKETYKKSETYNQNEIDEKLEDVNSTLELKADKIHTFTKVEVNDLLNAKANKDSVYNKDETYSQVEMDEKLDAKANIGNSYLKDETYSQEEIDEKLENLGFDSFTYSETIKIDTESDIATFKLEGLVANGYTQFIRNGVIQQTAEIIIPDQDFNNATIMSDISVDITIQDDDVFEVDEILTINILVFVPNLPEKV